jgi:hypothetical protein
MLRHAGSLFLVVVLLGQAAPAAARAGQAFVGRPITNQGLGIAHSHWSHEGTATFSQGRAFSRGPQGHWIGPGIRNAVPFGAASGIPVDDYDVISPELDYPFGSACGLELRPVQTLNFLTWRPVPVCGD